MKFKNPVRIRIKFLFPLLGILMFALVLSSLGNSYDDDEKLKHDAQQLVDMDKQEREAAQARYEKAHSSHSDGGAAGIILLFGIMAFVAYPLLKKLTNEKPRVLSSSPKIPFTFLKKWPPVPDFGTHKFDSFGFCKSCNRRREFLVKMQMHE